MVSGRAPTTRLFPCEWRESRDIHFLTVEDFEAPAARANRTIKRLIFLAGRRAVELLPNLLADVAVFLGRRRSSTAPSGW